MTAELQRPAIDLELMASDPGGRPGRLGCELLELRHLEFEHVADRRHGVLHAKDELHMQGLAQHAFFGKP